MENKDWELFLERAVHDIKDSVIKEEVREELLDHLEDRKERFMRFGDSEEEAERKSLELMGDRGKLRYEFGAIHNRFYLADLNGALDKIFAGFLFTFFNINFFGWNILSTFGSILIFVGAYQLRNVNSTLKKAWRMSLVSAVYSCFLIIGKAIPFFMQLDTDKSFAMTLVGIAITVVTNVTLFAGIKTLENCALVGKKVVTPSLTAAGVVYVLTQIIGVFVYMLETDEPDQGYGMIGAFIVIPLFIYILYVVWGVRKAIVASEYRTEAISEFGKNGCGILGVFAAILAVGLVLSCLTVAKPKVKSEVYVPPERTVEVEEIRKELISKGFPENVANILPDEEIKKCYPLYPDSDIYATIYNDDTDIDDYLSDDPYDIKPRVDVVTVPIYAEDGEHRDIRFIYTFEYTNSEDIRGYRDSLLVRPGTPPARNSESYGVFYKKDNVLYKEEPLKLYRNENFNTFCGFEFRTVKGADEMYGYFAANGSDGDHFTPLITYCFERYPWNYPYSSAYDHLKYGDGHLFGGGLSSWTPSEISRGFVQNWVGCYYPYERTAEDEVSDEEITDEEAFTQDEMSEALN